MDEEEVNFDNPVPKGYFYDEDEEGTYNEDDMLELNDYYRSKWDNIKKNIWDNLDNYDD